jgi:hypothetical protein
MSNKSRAKMAAEDFGALVRMFRETQSPSLRAFCREHNLDASNWSKIERGAWFPSGVKGIAALVKVLNIEGDNRYVFMERLFDALYAKVVADLKKRLRGVKAKIDRKFEDVEKKSNKRKRQSKD